MVSRWRCGQWLDSRVRRNTLELTQRAPYSPVVFTALVKNDQNIAKKQAGLSCAQFDMINCWLGLQLYQWDSFPLTIRRVDKIAVKKEWEKLSTEDLHEPIKETVYVNQIDIEELDDKQIQLIPNAR